jgi:hypothetical protein
MTRCSTVRVECVRFVGVFVERVEDSPSIMTTDREQLEDFSVRAATHFSLVLMTTANCLPEQSNI